MKRLLWLSANCSYSHSSLALPILQLAAQDVPDLDWLSAEALVQDDPADTALRLAQLYPDILAASLYIFNRTFLLDVLARLKTLLPHVTIVLGGPECLREGASELLHACPFVAYAISGEGEVPFRVLLQALVHDTPPELIPPAEGLLTRTSPPSTAICHDWQTRPTPAHSPHFRTETPFVQLETSRGCPFSCQYCTSGASTLRFRDLNDVRHDLQLLQQRGIRTVRLLDRTFNTPESRCLALLQLFRNDFPDIHFHLEIHPQFLTDKIRQELQCANPGQLHIEAGIQTLDNRVLQAVGRLPNAQQALSGLRFLASCHDLFDTHCDLLAGLPGQTFQTILDDLKQLLDARPAEIQLEVLKILPGTPLKRRAGELHLDYAPNPPYDVMRTPDLSPEDIRRVRSLSHVIDWFHNHPQLTTLFQTAASEWPDFITQLLHTVHSQSQTFQPHQPPGLDARLRFLHKFLPLSQMPHARFQLDAAWLRLANTPAKPGQPAENARLLPQLPPDASPLDACACARALQTTGTRFWKLDAPDHSALVFAYNRAISPNRAAAQWQLHSSTPT